MASLIEPVKKQTNFEIVIILLFWQKWKVLRLRAIRVIPEFDTPGHIGGAGMGIPGLQTQCCDKNGKFNGNYGPADPTKPEIYMFIDGLIKEWRQVFHDQYIHLGIKYNFRNSHFFIK